MNASMDVFRCCRPCLRRLISPNRNFATSSIAKQKKGLPEFVPSNSTELDDLLQTWRNKIFLPGSLVEGQRKIVYLRRNWPLLTNPDEPATARISDEVFQLHPIDRTKDEPDTRKSFYKILHHMRDTRDWSNLFEFLRGLHTAGRRLKSDQIEKMVRWLLQQERYWEIMEILRRFEENGISVWHPRVARELVWGALWRVARLGWTKTSIQNGAGFAENVLDLMAGPDHKDHPYWALASNRPAGRPEINGLLLQMHAARAVAFETNEDARRQTEKYARAVLTNWMKLDMEFNEDDWASINYNMIQWAPTWHGLKMAKNVLGRESPIFDSLDAKEKELRNLLQKGQVIVKEHTPEGVLRRGLYAYEETFKFPAK